MEKWREEVHVEDEKREGWKKRNSLEREGSKKEGKKNPEEDLEVAGLGI